MSISALPEKLLLLPKVIFSDVDDTLTHDGLLPAETFNALYRLRDAGFTVVPVTGASAGWCDCLMKTWPIQHMIGENGALTLQKDECGIVSTQFMKDAEAVKQDMLELKQIGGELLRRYPQIKYTQDQAFRLTDIAFDIGQTITVEGSVVREATEWLLAQNTQARSSSIHINVWLGEHSKATAAMSWLNQRGMSVQDSLFIGDSPNDEAMFQHFPVSVGVANVRRFLERMSYVPTYIAENEGGYGFAEMADMLLGSASTLR